jgi:hypothetical protein
LQENLDREKKVRADVEKAKRKVETDLKATQEAVEELDRAKHELEDANRKYVFKCVVIDHSLYFELTFSTR